MMRIIEYKDYKAYIRDLIHAMPRHGRGQYLRLSRLLKIHSSMVTYIFKGDSHLTVEQALLLSDEFNFSPLERDYFVNLVQLARAANPQTRAYFEEQLKERKKRFLNLSERVQNKTTLDEKDQAIFYSHWYFTAIRLLTAIKNMDHPKAIADSVGLDPKKVSEALDFLTRTGLCAFDGSRYSYGIAKTFLGRDSLFLDRHNSNWRMRAMQQYHKLSNEELAFTCPAVISREDFKKIREELNRLIEKFYTIVDPSPSEELVCLNIDWFKVRT